MINLYNSYTEKAIEIMRKGGICTPDELKIIDAAYSYTSYGDCDACGSHDYNSYYLGFGYCVIIADVQFQSEFCCSSQEEYEMEYERNAEEYSREYPLGQMYFRSFQTYDELLRNFLTVKLEKRWIDPRNDDQFNAIFQLGGMIDHKDYYCFREYVNYYMDSEFFPFFEGVIVLNDHEECRIMLYSQQVENRPEYAIYDTYTRCCGDFSYWCNGECRKDYSDSYLDMEGFYFLENNRKYSIGRVTG